MTERTYTIERDATTGPEPRYTIRGVELWAAHSYRGSKVTGEKPTVYDDSYTTSLVEKSKNFPAKSFVGHNYPGSAQSERKIRARVTNVRTEWRPDSKGVARKVAVGDVSQADPVLALSIARGHYTHRSPEVKKVNGEERITGLAWLGSRDQFFDFPEVKLDVDKRMVEQMKEDVKSMGPIDSEDIALLREAGMEFGGSAGEETVEKAETPEDQMRRLEGIIAEAVELSKEAIHRIANLEESKKLMSETPTKSEGADAKKADKPADTQEPDTVVTRETDELTKLREENEALKAAAAKAEAEAAEAKIRGDLETKYNTLHAEGALVNEKHREAVIAACLPIDDAKIREATFDALTCNMDKAPVEDETPEANTKGTTAPSILDKFDGEEATKVREFVATLGADAKKKAVAELKDLVKLREEDPSRSTWEARALDDAVEYTRAQLS